MASQIFYILFYMTVTAYPKNHEIQIVNLKQKVIHLSSLLRQAALHQGNPASQTGDIWHCLEKSLVVTPGRAWGIWGADSKGAAKHPRKHRTAHHKG